MRYDKETIIKLNGRSPLEKEWHWYELNTFKEWKKLGYYIKKGSKGLHINGVVLFDRKQVEVTPTREDRERAWKVYKTQMGSGCFYDHDEMNE